MIHESTCVPGGDKHNPIKANDFISVTDGLKRRND